MAGRLWSSTCWPSLYTADHRGGRQSKIPSTSGFAFNKANRSSLPMAKSPLSATAAARRSCGWPNFDVPCRPVSGKTPPFVIRFAAWFAGQPLSWCRRKALPMGAFELWVYHIKGGGRRASSLTDTSSDPYMHTIGAVASPYGKQLYYTPGLEAPRFAARSSVRCRQIVPRNRATGKKTHHRPAAGSGFVPYCLRRHKAGLRNRFELRLRQDPSPCKP